MKFEKKFSRRAFLGAAAAGGFAVSTCRFLQQAGVIPSSESENIENWRTKFTKEAQRSQTIEGAIVDRNGEPLTEPGAPAPRPRYWISATGRSSACAPQAAI